ncbi:hypothetical protein RHI9324_00478 [Rhizobium sp. CECT 9324]|nr:hypothetical protein RHI9324_00478 [Rhizobium sp. CECT 9324]
MLLIEQFPLQAYHLVSQIRTGCSQDAFNESSQSFFPFEGRSTEYRSYCFRRSPHGSWDRARIASANSSPRFKLRTIRGTMRALILPSICRARCATLTSSSVSLVNGISRSASDNARAIWSAGTQGGVQRRPTSSPSTNSLVLVVIVTRDAAVINSISLATVKLATSTPFKIACVAKTAKNIHNIERMGFSASEIVIPAIRYSSATQTDVPASVGQLVASATNVHSAIKDRIFLPGEARWTQLSRKI